MDSAVKDLLKEAGDCLRDGKPSNALSCVEKVIARAPKNAQAHNLAAHAHAAMGAVEAAAESYNAAATHQTGWFAPLANLGLLYQNAGNLDLAEDAYRRALEVEPRVAEIWNNLGNALRDLGRLVDAEAALAKACDYKPEWGAPWFNRALVCQMERRPEDALVHIDRALACDARFAGAHRTRSAILLRLRRYDDAIAAGAAAVAIDRTADNLSQLGLSYKGAGAVDEAIKAFETALEIEPLNVLAQFHLTTTVPVISRDEAEVDLFRRRFSARLEQLAEAFSNPDAELAERLWEALGSGTNFPAHYLGGDFCADQTLYGSIADRALAAVNPDLHGAPPIVSRKRDRPRVGFVSSLLHHHTVGKLFGRWVTELDREKFEVVYYNANGIVDDYSERLAHRVDHYRFLTGDVLSMAAAIRDDDLDAVIFPEVGMAPHVALLAAVRLAPVQAMAWGHPITSGLPSMDLFLSSAAMETPDSDRQYAEQLVRLPNLSICYDMPDVSDAMPDRAAFGLDPDRAVILACQAPMKFQPAFDYVFADIAEKAPDAQIAFIEHRSETANKVFAARLDRAFQAQNRNWRDHCVVVPRMDQSAWFSLNKSADVFLDSIGWSGGNTTLEALACDLPIVTLPGEQMRSRHTAGVLECMGLGDQIASSVASYVDMAANLATSPKHRTAMSSAVIENRAKVFNDHDPLVSLAEVLETAIQASPGNTQ